MNAAVEEDALILKYDVVKDYKLGRVLGKGAFAEVRVGTLLKDKNQVRAIKIVDVKALSTNDVDALDLEIKTMRRLKHHNIVALYDVYSYRDKFVMVLELCKGGELFDRVVSKEFYSEREARFSFVQMVEAIGHCHQKGVVHRDLKPENLLYADKEGTPNADIIKLADFGLASMYTQQSSLSTACGTPGYVSPEILEASKGKGYGKECDLWSLGVILYILLCGYPPFYDENNNNSKIFKMIKAGEFTFADPYWTDISKDAKDLVKRLLTVDVEKRITAPEVFEHNWIKSDEAANSLHLPHFVDNMHKYNLRRKFKGAILSIMAGGRITNFGAPTQAKKKEQPAAPPAQVPASSE